MNKIRITVPTVLFSALALSAGALAQTPAPGAAATPPKPAAAAPAGAAPAGKPAAAPMKTAPPPSSAASAGSAGVPAGAPPMPAPSKEMEAFMKGFEGNWHCDTTFAAGAMGPGSPEATAKTAVKIKKEFGGMAWHGEYSLPKSKTMPSMSGVFQISHDPASNQAIIVGYDSMGSGFLGTGTVASDSVTFVEEGYMMGAKVKTRETMTKKGPKEVHHKYEVDMGKGFQPMGEDLCKK